MAEVLATMPMAGGGAQRTSQPLLITACTEARLLQEELAEEVSTDSQCAESTEGGSGVDGLLDVESDVDSKFAGGGVAPLAMARDYHTPVSCSFAPRGLPPLGPGSLLSQLRARGNGVLARLSDAPAASPPLLAVPAPGTAGVVRRLPHPASPAGTAAPELSMGHCYRTSCSPAQALDLLIDAPPAPEPTPATKADSSFVLLMATTPNGALSVPAGAAKAHVREPVKARDPLADAPLPAELPPVAAKADAAVELLMATTPHGALSVPAAPGKFSSMEPLKISLPADAAPPTTTLDLSMPAKKLPRFAELCGGAERAPAFDPCMPLKKRVPGTLLGSAGWAPIRDLSAR